MPLLACSEPKLPLALVIALPVEAPIASGPPSQIVIPDSGETDPLNVTPVNVPPEPALGMTPEPVTASPKGPEIESPSAHVEVPGTEGVAVSGTAPVALDSDILTTEASGLVDSVPGLVSTTVSSTVSTWQFGTETLHSIGTSREEVAYCT